MITPQWQIDHALYPFIQACTHDGDLMKYKPNVSILHEVKPYAVFSSSMVWWSIQVVERLRGILPVVIDGEDWEEPAEELDGGFPY